MKKLLSLIVGVALISGCGGESYEYENETQQDDVEVVTEGMGYIEGSLSFPSEGIPDNLMVCTENEKGSSCGTFYERLEGEDYTYGLGYKVEVPVGSYKVFSKTDVSSFDPMIGGYTNYVECGMLPECDNHKMIMVNVIEGETVSGIDLEDFQAEFY